MLVQPPKWADFLSCLICRKPFEGTLRQPISLGCGHTICKSCLSSLQRNQCPIDQSIISMDIKELPLNHALLQLVDNQVPENLPSNFPSSLVSEDVQFYNTAKKSIENIALYLRSQSPVTINGILHKNQLSKPMQRKLVTLVGCQLFEEEGRKRAMRAARSLGERSVTELILQQQTSQQLSAALWAVVRARGCQFLGPAMQEEVLKLLLLALEDGSALSRKVLVRFVVQRLSPQFPQASKTSIGHVVQLLYRASCFKVSKRDQDSSLMQLKEEFCTYEALRREHDAQIVQIAIEAGLRITPEQWSALLYGDTIHKSHMQSIIDKLLTPQAFSQSVQELLISLQRNGDPSNLSDLKSYFELLASIDPCPKAPPPSWKNLSEVLHAVAVVVKGLVEHIKNFGCPKLPEIRLNANAKYKTSMCRDFIQRKNCPRGLNCTFAHSQKELEKFLARSRPSNEDQQAGPSTRTYNSASNFNCEQDDDGDDDASLFHAINEELNKGDEDDINRLVANNEEMHSDRQFFNPLNVITLPDVRKAIWAYNEPNLSEAPSYEVEETSVNNVSIPIPYLSDGRINDFSLFAPALEPDYSEYHTVETPCPKSPSDESSTSKPSQVSSIFATLVSNIIDYKSWCHADPPNPFSCDSVRTEQ